MCIALVEGKHHDWVLDTLSLPQVFLYWDNIGIVAGYGKRAKRKEAQTEEDPHEWVWDQAAGQYVAFDESERERYEWNAKMRQYEV